MNHKHPFLFALALLPAVMLQAQNEAPARNFNPSNNPSNTNTTAVQSDAILATWLHVASTNEITLAGVALKQGQNADVRAFAQKMIDDHTAFAAKLQPLTTSSTGVGKTGGEYGKEGKEGKEGKDAKDAKDTKEHGKPESDTSKGKNPADASSPRGQMTGGNFDHASLIRDLGKKCLQSETTMLTSKTGAEFDRAYMRMMVASHVRGADMVEVFKTYASANLMPTLEAGQKTIAEHLEHAKTLCKQVDSSVADSGTGGSKNPRDGR